MRLSNLTYCKSVLLCLLAGLFMTSCGGGGDSAATGTLSTLLTDASTVSYQAVYVTISRVEVHADGGAGWQTVANPNQTYNLLELVNGVRETLGIAVLDAGHYTQMRLVLGGTPDADVNIFSLPHPFANYVIDQDDVVQELTVPSGMTTGLKVVNGFDINPDQTTELILDFDAMHSVVIAGSSGKYQLKPTVKVLDVADGVIVSGGVSEAGVTPPVLLDRALVMAQVADPGNAEAADQVVIESGTLSVLGDYALFLAAGDYNLVAVKDDYLSICVAASLMPASHETVGFALDPVAAAPGSITGSVSIGGASSDQVVTIDVRQELTCEGALDPAVVTIKSINVANGGGYDLALPAGTYQIVASTFGHPTQAIDNVVVVTAVATDLGALAF